MSALEFYDPSLISLMTSYETSENYLVIRERLLVILRDLGVEVTRVGTSLNCVAYHDMHILDIVINFYRKNGGTILLDIRRRSGDIDRFKMSSFVRKLLSRLNNMPFEELRDELRVELSDTEISEVEKKAMRDNISLNIRSDDKTLQEIGLRSAYNLIGELDASELLDLVSTLVFNGLRIVDERIQPVLYSCILKTCERLSCFESSEIVVMMRHLLEAFLNTALDTLESFSKKLGNQAYETLKPSGVKELDNSL